MLLPSSIPDKWFAVETETWDAVAEMLLSARRGVANDRAKLTKLAPSFGRELREILPNFWIAWHSRTGSVAADAQSMDVRRRVR